MKIIKTFAILCALGSVEVNADQVAPSRENSLPERVSFYEVPLVCPAAPQLGCGRESKPLLLELERSPAVAEAWLNRAGTLLAIVWTEQSKSRERAKALSVVLKERDITPKELFGKAKRQALRDFEPRKEWYRGADVDRLSEEEAAIVANRWISRFREKIVMTDAQAKALQDSFTAEIRRRLVGQITRDEAIKNMTKIAHQYLDEKSVAILLESFGGALRPSEEK
jgi:hypothetical protein